MIHDRELIGLSEKLAACKSELADLQAKFVRICEQLGKQLGRTQVAENRLAEAKDHLRAVLSILSLPSEVSGIHPMLLDSKLLIDARKFIEENP